MHLYKGVAPGTYYARGERVPTRVGFTGDSRQARAVDDLVRHITAHSWPSAWVSVTTSFAIAADYATKGGAVYEIILSRIGPADVTDPIAELGREANASLSRFIHHHDGHQDLIPNLARPLARTKALSAAPLRAGAPPARRGPPPMVSPYLNALV